MGFRRGIPHPPHDLVHVFVDDMGVEHSHLRTPSQHHQGLDVPVVYWRHLANRRATIRAYSTRLDQWIGGAGEGKVNRVRLPPRMHRLPVVSPASLGFTMTSVTAPARTPADQTTPRPRPTLRPPTQRPPTARSGPSFARPQRGPPLTGGSP